MKSFEERLARLEKLSNILKEGNTPLEEAVTLFEEGIKLAKHLENELTKTERKVEILLNDPSEASADRSPGSNHPKKEPMLELFPELSDEDNDSVNENHPGK